MAFIDYYKILGVDKNIPQDDVTSMVRNGVRLVPSDREVRVEAATTTLVAVTVRLSAASTSLASAERAAASQASSNSCSEVQERDRAVVALAVAAQGLMRAR